MALSLSHSKATRNKRWSFQSRTGVASAPLGPGPPRMRSLPAGLMGSWMHGRGPAAGNNTVFGPRRTERALPTQIATLSGQRTIQTASWGFARYAMATAGLASAPAEKSVSGKNPSSLAPGNFRNRELLAPLRLIRTGPGLQLGSRRAGSQDPNRRSCWQKPILWRLTPAGKPQPSCRLLKLPVKRASPAGALEPARLAILADALEDAGCANVRILKHLRSHDAHLRCCWVVNCLLGKEDLP